MLDLIELRFQGIGRFIEQQKVNFSALNGFTQIDGQNNNTGGSSGSGKSTIANALDYLLKLNDLPATILQSRKNVNHLGTTLNVQGDFLWNESPVEITRGPSLLKVKMADQTIEGKQAEEKIDEILGMPRDLFRKIIHKRQKEGGFFLKFTPKEMHEFLMDCTNLSPFKKHYETIDAKLKGLEEHKVAVENNIQINQSGLSATQDAILALGLAPIKDIHQEVIYDLKEKHDKSAIRLKNVIDECESAIKKYVQNRPLIDNLSNDDSVREGLEKRSKEIESTIQKILENERKRQEAVRQAISDKNIERGSDVARIDKGKRAKEDATAIALHIKSIRNQMCPTCEQNWTNEGSIASENAARIKLAELKPTIDDGIQAGYDIIVTDEELSDLKTKLSPVYHMDLPDLNEELAEITEQIMEEKRKAGLLYEQQSEENKRKLDEFVFGQGELTKKHKAETDQARGQYDVDRRVWESAVAKLVAYESAKSQFETTYNKLKEKEKSFEKNLLEWNSDLESTVKEQILALETKKAIKMYISFKFDEALEAIGDKATKIIRCIPNMSNATIQFEGTKETKEGKVNEQVNAVIGMDGETGVPIKSLSGGEGSSTDLAVDLAVIDYIESKTAKGMNIFILDEPFNGLGTVEIEMALEVLKNANTNKKLIIVDHNPEVKQMVQSRLVVVRNGLTSQVS